MAERSSWLTSCVSAHGVRALGVAAMCALAPAGCGGDDEGERESARTSTAPAQTTPRTETQPTSTLETSPPETPPTSTEPGAVESPEDQPGGAGDEVPARSQASLTGTRGRITPRVVLVPPFIAVRVELRSADGRPYELSTGNRRLSVDSQVASVSTTFAGLRPGRRLVLQGTGGRVVIEASAEPGP